MWWSFGDDLARLGMIIVDPTEQGRGLGRIVVDGLLDALAPRSAMLLATEAGTPLYRKLGFIPIGSTIQHQGIYTGAPVEDPRLQQATEAHLNRITTLDASAFGLGRMETLSALLGAGRGVVLEQDGTVVGYAFERRFGRGSVVGPIVASSEADAIVLLRALARPGFVRVDRMEPDVRFGESLETAGLAPLAGASPVMARGDWPKASGDAHIFALASHALG